jgi:hypothetical protein
MEVTMNQPGIHAWIILAFMQLRAEQMKENEPHPFDEEQAENLSGKRKPSKVMATIGKRLTSLGTGLEARYGMQPAAITTMNQQSNPGGC